MAQFIGIVGGLPAAPSPGEILERLRACAGEEVAWELALADANGAVPGKIIRGFLTRLQQEQAACRKRGGGAEPIVVKLYILNGRTQNLIHAACRPVLAPKSLLTVEDFFEWLVSPEANVVPRREWWGNEREAALVAILAKLVRRNSWSNTMHGHDWTKEKWLLKESPVLRSNFQMIAVEAEHLVERLDGRLLTSKGGSDTPKEWAIKSQHKDVVMQILVNRSFEPLRVTSDFEWLYNYVTALPDRPYRLDGDLVDERTLYACRMREPAG